MKFMFWVFMMMAAVTLSSCKVKERVMIEHKTDTLRITKHQRDSIWMHDSVYVSEKQLGDTVWVEVARWRTRYVIRETHDTLYNSHTDSIPIPYPVEVKVPAEISRWQRWKMNMGLVFIGIMAVSIIFGGWCVKRRFWP